MNCPYCDAEQEVCHDDGHGYEEGKAHEHTCSECEKTFVFYTSISFYYEPQKADCLNGAAHQWKMSKTFPSQFSKMICCDCGEQRQPKDEEFKQAGIDLDKGSA